VDQLPLAPEASGHLAPPKRSALLRPRKPHHSRHHDGLPPSRIFRGQSIDPYPNLKANLARIGQRPAYQRAMAKAEPGVAPKLD
jgi:hypothetical protein